MRDFSDILNLIYNWYSLNNANQMDHKITNGDFVALIHHDLDATSGFSSPTNAKHTVSAGKKALVVKVEPTRTTFADPNFRGMRLFNTTDNLDVVRLSDFWSGHGIPDGGIDTDGTIPEIASGKTVELQTWNNGAASRIRGGFVVLMEG